MSKPQTSNQTGNDEFPPLLSFQDATYLRPNQKWICGQECGGCALGPTAKGDCQAGAECRPRRHNDSWLCNRSKLQGGKCKEGPTADGECCRKVTSCVPRLEARQKRYQFTFWCVAAMIGAGALMLSSDRRNEFIVPGALTQQHAEFFRDHESKRCAECHGTATAGLPAWTLAAISPKQAVGKTQPELCMECHDKTISAATALAAHSLPVGRLNDLSAAAKQRLGDGATRAVFQAESEVACAACHGEHHGANFDLTAMSNAQCATCHQDQFTSFGDAHPGFGDWPYERRTRIAFDHVAHQAKYFPESNQGEFDCAMCHEQGGPTGIVSVNSFEKACASCHDKKIEQGNAAGLAVLALPMLDLEAMQQQGLAVGQWPENASGSFDGGIAPMMRLLLGSDRRAWAALEQFGPDFDFLDIDVENVDELEAAHDIAWGIKQLVYDLARDAKQTFRQRLERSLHAAVSVEQAEALSAQLSPELISELQRQWFPKLMEEVPNYRQQKGLPADGLEGAAMTDGDIMIGNLPVGSRLGSAGGDWVRDDETCELKMQPRNHASAFLHSWIDLLGSNSQRVLPETSWPLRSLMLKQTGLGQCVTCHSVDQKDENHFVVNWAHDEQSSRSLTKFAHGPHLLQPGLESCTSCHELAPSQRVMANYDGYDPTSCVSNFAPMSQQACARCHHPEGAGDSCLKCHDYHAKEHLSPLSAVLSR